MILLSVMLGAFLMYLLQKYLYRKYWDKNLSVNLSLSAEKAVEGDEVILYETVTNKKLLPLPILEVKFKTSRNLIFQNMNNSNITDFYYRNDLLSVMMYQKLTRSLPFICSRRGYYTIHNIDAVCSDLFMTSEAVATLDTDIRLYVYPKPVNFQKLEASFNKILGSVLTKRFINEDPFEFRGIREYQTYDDLKSVNWKASAKTGSLKVNVNDYTSSWQVKIFLNLESDSIWKREDLEEESIRLTLSLASAFITRGIPVSLYTNGIDILTHEKSIIPAGSGSNHITVFNEVLARIDTSQEVEAFVPAFYKDFYDSGKEDYIVIISFYQKEDLQNLLNGLLTDGYGFSWIVPCNRDVAVSPVEELSPYVIPWEAEPFNKT